MTVYLTKKCCFINENLRNARNTCYVIRDRSLFSGGRRAAKFGGRVTIF